MHAQVYYEYYCCTSTCKYVNTKYEYIEYELAQGSIHSKQYFIFRFGRITSIQILIRLVVGMSTLVRHVPGTELGTEALCGFGRFSDNRFVYFREITTTELETFPVGYSVGYCVIAH